MTGEQLRLYDESIQLSLRIGKLEAVLRAMRKDVNRSQDRAKLVAGDQDADDGPYLMASSFERNAQVARRVAELELWFAQLGTDPLDTLAATARELVCG